MSNRARPDRLSNVLSGRSEARPSSRRHQPDHERGAQDEADETKQPHRAWMLHGVNCPFHGSPVHRDISEEHADHGARSRYAGSGDEVDHVVRRNPKHPQHLSRPWHPATSRLNEHGAGRAVHRLCASTLPSKDRISRFDAPASATITQIMDGKLHDDSRRYARHRLAQVVKGKIDQDQSEPDQVALRKARRALFAILKLGRHVSFLKGRAVSISKEHATGRAVYWRRASTLIRNHRGSFRGGIRPAGNARPRPISSDRIFYDAPPPQGAEG